MNALNQLTHPQQMLIALLKLALWNRVPDKVLFEKANDLIWNEVYILSAYQGVKAIVFDGILLLSEELQPPRSIKLKWAVNVEAIEHRYEQELAVANEIADIFTKNNIKILLFKGIGLAQYYPLPQHREFGDIDFYLFGKQEEGDRLLIQSGAVEEKYNIQIPKHTGLQYKRIPLENHKYFLSNNVAALEKRLLETVSGDKPLSSRLVNNALFPSPDFNVLFMVCHTFGHFLAGHLLLRDLCDWTLFLKANKGAIDFVTWRRLITESCFIKFADALTALSVKYLEFDLELAPPFESNPIIEDRIMQESFNPLLFPKTEKQTFLKIIGFKMKLLESQKWKYKELFSLKQFYKGIGNSIIIHIAHPAITQYLKKNVFSK